jgi:hypothetical protein
MVPMFALIAAEAAAPAIAAATIPTLAGAGALGAGMTGAGLASAAGTTAGAGLAGAAGTGALTAGMTGAALTPAAAAAPAATTLASSAPQLTSLAQASPEIAANLSAVGQGAASATGAVAPEVAAAGQGIMQGVAPQAAAPLQAAGSSPATTAGAQNVFGTASFQPPAAAGGQPGFGAPVVTPSVPPPPAPQPSFGGGIMDSLRNGFSKALEFAQDNKYTIGLGLLGAQMMNRPSGPKKEKYGQRDMSGFTAGGEPSPYMALGRAGFAEGGPVEAMSNMNAVGGNPYYPMSQQPRLAYANPSLQNPISQNVLDVGEGGRLDPYTGMPAFAKGGETTTAQLKTPDYRKMLEGKSPQEVEQDYQDAKQAMDKFGFGIVPRSRAQQLSSPATAAQAELSAMMKKYGIKSALPKVKDPMEGSVEEAAGGGIMYNLGGYSDGGRLLKGPGDGVSDSIPASIGGRQPARLADGEFVIPARIVSELGNGSTDAGARKLYAMMDRVQKGRKKSVGKGKVAVNSKADKHLPA